MDLDALFKADNAAIRDSFDELRNADVPGRVVELQTFLEEALASEAEVVRARRSIRSKFRTCQRLMMACWQIETEVVTASTVCAVCCVKPTGASVILCTSASGRLPWKTAGGSHVLRQLGHPARDAQTSSGNRRIVLAALPYETSTSPHFFDTSLAIIVRMSSPLPCWCLSAV